MGLPSITHHDFLIIGAGLTGATIARLAHDAGFHPLVVERRGVIGGNVRDEIHGPTGLRYNLYGPHYFRTNSARVWEFVQRFAAWRPWAAEVTTLVDGKLEHWPPNREYIDRVSAHPIWKWIGRTDTFTGACLTKMPPETFYSMVKPYTEKQWGMDANELDASLASRFQIREDSSDHRLSQAKWQALPVDGYSAFVERMLEGTDVKVNMTVPVFGNIPVVFTGPIDELFDLRFGRLPYRAQWRETELTVCNPKIEHQIVQINDPRPDVPIIRSIHWNVMSEIPPDYTTHYGLRTCEFPYTPENFDQCEYPVPTAAARAQYALYAAYAEQHAPNIIFAGRLAEYRYLDMDQAIARAMTTWEKRVRPRLLEK